MVRQERWYIQTPPGRTGGEPLSELAKQLTGVIRSENPSHIHQSQRAAIEIAGLSTGEIGEEEILNIMRKERIPEGSATKAAPIVAKLLKNQQNVDCTSEVQS